MNRKVLIVDDEDLMLVSYKRKLQKMFEIEIANRGASGLEMIKEKGPFAVIISDFRMPEMDGVQFLAKAEKLTPKSIRIMLTGQAGFQDAINAVNHGGIFRFLTKPCPPEQVQNVIEAGIEQYRLIHAEKELLEKTLTGSIKTLSDILSLSHPEAFSQANRLKHYVESIATKMELDGMWQYKLAALLSQIGCISLTSEMLTKMTSKSILTEAEQKMIDALPEVSASLIQNIPRLGVVAEMIRMQNENFEATKQIYKENNGRLIARGAQLLRIAKDYDAQIVQGHSPKMARSILEKNAETYNPQFLECLQTIVVKSAEMVIREITVEQLRVDMIVDEDIYAGNGHILINTGQVVTEPVIQRLENFARGIGVKEPFRVKMKGKNW